MARSILRRLGDIRGDTVAVIILVILLIGGFHLLTRGVLGTLRSIYNLLTRNHTAHHAVTINAHHVKFNNKKDSSIKAKASKVLSAGCPDAPLGANLLPRRTSCLHPRTRLVFLQTHDPSAASAAALTLRHAYYNNLTIAAPIQRTGHIGYPSPYRPHFIFGYWFSETHFDVLAHHVRYDRCFMQKDFKLASTVYVTMLREPWSLFTNAVQNTGNKTLGLAPKRNRIKTVLRDFEKYSKPVQWKLDLSTASLMQNTMSFDLGFDPSFANDRKKIDLFISRTEQDFDLVMMAENFDESLIMLKRLMCWSLKDVFYLKPKSENKTEENITDEMKHRHRKYSNVDYELYDYFSKNFALKLQMQPPDFLEEVEAFKTLNSKVNDFCSSEDVVEDPNESLVLPRMKAFTERLVVDATDCQRMRQTPDDYTLLVRTMLSKRDAPTYRKMPWPFED